ncbi:MAG: SIMPL domain-containing protein [Acidimicrobiales bacterium]|nr:SIMPL domain-containing protein [Acidimicrobiales bacterium]
MDASTVIVRGEATARARPDRVHLAVVVRALEADPDAALEEASRRLAAVQEVLDGEGVAPADRVTESVSLAEEREWVKDRLVHRGWAASARTAVALPDATGIGRILRRAVQVSGAEVQGPWWWVAPDNPARLEACGAAAAEARRKAQAYAEALGVRLGAVVAVAEPGLGNRPTPQADTGPAVRMMAKAAAPAEPVVEAGDLTVAAAVEVTFRLEP